MSDLGLTHVAFAVQDLAASLVFYEKYAAMRLVHRRADPAKGSGVAWVTDFTRPFVLVLIQAPGVKDTPLGPFGHLGVACDSRETVDRLAALAKAEGVLVSAPTDSGPPVGYWTYLRDPDGNILELAHGQEVAFIVEQAAEGSGSGPG